MDGHGSCQPPAFRNCELRQTARDCVLDVTEFGADCPALPHVSILGFLTSWFLPGAGRNSDRRLA